MNAKEIASGLWQSPFAHVLPEWEKLQAEIDIIVLMAELAGGVPDGVPLLYFPIPDDPQGCESLDTVRMLAETVSSLRVLSVCHMGENRSGLLSALILRARGILPKDAVAQVQERGPAATDPERGSFWNPGFVRQASE